MCNIHTRVSNGVWGGGGPCPHPRLGFPIEETGPRRGPIPPRVERERECDTERERARERV